MKAIWKDTVIAESDETVIVEGNHYLGKGLRAGNPGSNRVLERRTGY